MMWKVFSAAKSSDSHYELRLNDVRVVGAKGIRR